MLEVVIFILMSIIFLYPGIVYLYAFLKNNFSLSYLQSKLNFDASFDGFGGLPPAPKFNIDGDDTDINCSNGYKLGDKNEPKDCQTICNGAQYEYKFVKNKVTINNIEIKGAWCLPKAIAQCNLNTSRAIIGKNGYECITIFPDLLGGQTGNDIIGCSPFYSFIDNLTKQTYTKFIPTNIVINDLEEVLSTGKKRYTCALKNENIIDEYMNVPDTLGSRFDLERNNCKIFDPDGIYDESSGKCVCAKYINDDPSSVCTRCTSGFGIVDENIKQLGSSYSHNIGQNCVDPELSQYHITRFALRPCGINTLRRIKRHDDLISCERGQIYATTSYSGPKIQRMFS